MRIKLDQNLPQDLVQVLALRGHDVRSVWDQGLAGVQDQDLSGICRTEDRVLITLDMDFADILSYPPAQSAGIIVLRCPIQSRRHVMTLALFAVDALTHEELRGATCIAEPGRVRVRGS